MRLAVPLLALLVLAGCGSTPQTDPAASHEGKNATDPFHLKGDNNTTSGPPTLYLRDPDVLGFQRAGVRTLDIHANKTFKINLVTVTGTANQLRWILAYPRTLLSNATGPCSPAPAALHARSFSPRLPYDTLTNAPLAPGNWTLLVWSDQLSNVTVHVNTTVMTSYRHTNGTAASFRNQTLDADPHVESNSNPYRVSFNKTFATRNRSLVLSAFTVTSSAFFAPHDIRSKIESGTGFLCAERDLPIGPTAGGATWISSVAALLPEPGTHTFTGRFESETAYSPMVNARADVLSWE